MILEWANLIFSIGGACLCVYRSQEIAKHYGMTGRPIWICMVRRFFFLVLSSMIFVNGVVPTLLGVHVDWIRFGLALAMFLVLLSVIVMDRIEMLPRYVSARGENHAGPLHP